MTHLIFIGATGQLSGGRGQIPRGDPAGAQARATGVCLLDVQDWSPEPSTTSQPLQQSILYTQK